MKKIGHIFTILLTYLVGLALLVLLVFGSVNKGNPDYLSAKQSFLNTRKELMQKHKNFEFYIWTIKAGSVDIYDTSTIQFAKSDKWRNTFIRYDKRTRKMEMVVATLEKGKLTGEGIFDVQTTEKPRTLLPKLKENNRKLASWKTDSSTLYYQNLFLVKERRYRKLKAIEIDMTGPNPNITLSFVRKMTSIERKAFALENHFVLNLELSFNGKIKGIKEMPIDI